MAFKRRGGWCALFVCVLLFMVCTNLPDGGEEGPRVTPRELNQGRATRKPSGLKQLQTFMRRQQEKAPSSKRQGILVVGEREQIANAYVNLRILREHLHCHLPVEIVYYGSAEAPRPELHTALTSIPDVIIKDISQITLPPDFTVPDSMKDLGYFTKIYALVFGTSFTEVLLLDSDNLPLISPEALMKSKMFRQHGNLFWPDWWRHNGSGLGVDPHLYERFGLQVPWAGEMDEDEFRCTESGQFLFNRERHADVLLWLLWLIQQPNMTDMHGDKDLYRVAFALANKHRVYQQVDLPARNAVNEYLKFMGMVQLCPDGRPAFHHRTGPAKYIPYNYHTLHGLNSAKVSYLSAILEPEEAVEVVKELRWQAQLTDMHAWDNDGCDYSNMPASQPAYKEVPEIWCSKLTLEGPRRIPMYTLDKFGHAGKLMNMAHELMVETALKQPVLMKPPE